MRASIGLAAAAALLLSTACGDRGAAPPAPTSEAGSQGNTAPSESTRAANAAVARSLDLADPQDFEDAERGLEARHPELVVRAEDGRVIWEPAQYAFVDGDA